MELNKLQQHLQMKELTSEHLSQFNELLRYVFQVTNQNLHEVGWLEDEIEQAKLPVLEKANVLGWFDDDKLISQVAVYPFQVNIHGVIYEMGGVTGVGTYPEYAKMGLMHQLLQEALNVMRKRKQTISYLYPYSIPYYRRKGWEIMSDIMTFSIKDIQLPPHIEVPGIVHRVETDHPDIQTTYNAFALANHGAMIRNSLAWEEYWRWETEEMIAAIYYNAQNQATGYVLYWIAEDVFHLKEIVSLTEEARRGLWNFISAHESMIDKVQGFTYTLEPIAFLFEDSEMEETVRPYFMARIVDVIEFLKKYPFDRQTQPFHFDINDPLLEWNQGVFSIQWDDNDKLLIGKDAIGEKVEVDIQSLTTMLMSYKRPEYLAKIGRIKASKHMLKELSSIIPPEEPYFSDYY